MERQLWQSSGETGLAVGEAVEVDTWGWVESADGSTSRLAYGGSPRLEPGHTHAVVLIAKDCATDELSWSTLGSGAVIPADGGKIGYGESEGRIVAGDADQAPTKRLELRFLGEPPAALGPVLDAAQAEFPPEHHPRTVDVEVTDDGPVMTPSARRGG